MPPRKQQTVLFLCTSNYYRSRFAEALFNSVAKKFALPWVATSRGLAVEQGIGNFGSMALAALEALDARGLNGTEATTRSPQQVTADDLKAADRIIALNQVEHQPMLQERFPEWADKVEYWNVDDSSETIAQLERGIDALVARIFGGSIQQAAPVPSPAKAPAKKPPTVKVGRETAGRRGRGVTTVFDVPLDEAGLADLAATLKNRCGTGGTVKDGRIEIQGDQRERIIAELEKLGYQAKRVGG